MTGFSQNCFFFLHNQVSRAVPHTHAFKQTKIPLLAFEQRDFLHGYGSAYAFTITCLGQTSTQAPQPVHLS